MYDLFNDFIGILPTRYQFIIPIVFIILILLLITIIVKLLGGRL